MTIDPEKILYAVLGGVSMMLVQYIHRRLHGRISGNDLLLKYATLIKRQARLRREVEKIMRENKSIRSIVLQGIDAAYITLQGRAPCVAMLHLRKDRDALLFRHCLKRLNDPETVYALASRQKPLSDMPESACTEFRDYADQTDSTWFRFTHGKNATDEKVDDAMLEQLLTLTASNDGSLSQSGSCHIALRRQNAEGLADIVVMPTSFLFRKAFKKAYGSDDLTAYNAEELFEKILTTRAKMVTG